jgi:hypothetical protein
MKLVKEHINEKFEEESDPIIDMGIGNIELFKNFLKLFSEADKQHYIFTIHVDKDFIDFWFNRPTIKNLSDAKQSNLFNYIKNIIHDLGFSNILIKPKLIMHVDKQDSYFKNIQVELPGIVQFKIIHPAQNIIKSAEYRNYKGEFQFHEKMSPREYEEKKKEKHIKKDLIK